MKTIKLLCVSLLVLLTAAIICAQDSASSVISDDWYDVLMQGQKAGFMHAVVEQTKYQDKDCYKSTSEMSIKIQRGKDDFFSISEKVVGYEDMDFNPLYQSSTKQDGVQTTVLEAIISGDDVTFKKTLNKESPLTSKIKSEKGVIFGIDGYMLNKKGLLKVGANATFRTVSLDLLDLATETIKIIKEDKITIGGKEYDSYLCESTSTAMPGITMKMNLDKQGTMLRMDMAVMELVKSTEKASQEMKKTAVFNIFIKTNAKIPRLNSVSEMQLSVTLKEAYDNPIPENEYQSVKQDKDKYLVTLKSVPMDITDTPKVPFTGESLKRYLQPSLAIQSDDAQIVAQVKEIVKGEKDSLKIAQALTEWIYKNIKKESGGTASNSAKETFMEKAGDCTEHSALLCAFARAAGVPARQISGMVFDGSSFGYHAWDELYFGKWIPADATCNRVGIPAGYIRVGETEAGEKGDSIATAGVLKLFGNISIEVLSAKDNDNKSIDLSGKDSDKDKSFSIKFPKDWKRKRGNPGVAVMGMAPEDEQGGSPANVSVIVADLPIPMAPSDFLDATVKVLKHSASFAEIERGQTTVNNAEMKWILYTQKNGDTDVKVKMYIAVVNFRAYAITCTAQAAKYAGYTDTFDDIIKSFKIKQ